MASPSHPWLTSQPPFSWFPLLPQGQEIRVPPLFIIKAFPVDAEKHSEIILPLPPLLAFGIRRIKKTKVAISTELRGALGPDPTSWVRH